MTDKAAATSIDRQPARRGRPSRTQEREITEAIIQTALRLFLAEGYGVTSMKKIGEQAGVAPNTLYARFPDKAALFRAVIEWKTATWKVTNPPRRPRPQAGIVEVLETIFTGMLEAIQREDIHALGRLLAIEADRFPELAQIYREGPMTVNREDALGWLRDAPDTELSGEAAADVMTTATELVIGHEGMRIFQSPSEQVAPVRQVAKRMARVIGHGLVTRPLPA